MPAQQTSQIPTRSRDLCGTGLEKNALGHASQHFGCSKAFDLGSETGTSGLWQSHQVPPRDAEIACSECDISGGMLLANGLISTPLVSAYDPVGGMKLISVYWNVKPWFSLTRV